MKKLFLLMMFVASSLLSIKAQTGTIQGPISVSVGTSHEYTLKLNTPVTQDTYVTVATAFGFINKENESMQSLKISKGSSDLKFIVKWMTSSTGANININGQGGSTINIFRHDIVVKSETATINPGTGTGCCKDLDKTGSTSAILEGPLVLKAGEEAEYKINENKYDNRGYATWDISREFLEIIKETPISIKVRAKNIGTMNAYINVNFCYCLSLQGKNDILAKKRMYITIIPNFKIEPISALAVCSGGNASYKLEGYGIGAEVEWRGSANMTLISGQGTANAIFKSTGNGAGIVSAFIKYKGEDFICENSRVWIGPEAAPSIDGDLGSINTAMLNSEYGFYAKGLPRNTIGRYRWGYGAKNSLKYIETDINFAVLKSPSSGTSFMVTLSVETPCGWSPTSSIVYGINSGGKDKGPVYPLKNALVIDEDQPEIKSVKIYNLSGVLLYSNDAVNGSFDIKSTVLTDGVYIIEKFDGENRTSEKVMLKR